MGIAIPQVITSDRASGALVIDGSVRFDSSKSQSLTRTPGSAGNRKTWTYSAWVKTIPGAFSASNHKNLLSVDSGSASDSERMHLFLGNASDKIQHDLHGSSPRVSSSVYRDIDRWYHVVVKFDSTQAPARGQIAWYINGEQVVNWDTESTLTQNGDYAVNGAYLHRIGANNAAGPGQFWDGRMSQVYMVDGLALGPSYFGFTDPLTGTWRPKKFRAQGTTVNDGTTWSNSVSGTEDSGWSKTQSFDGILSSSSRASNGNSLTWTPSTPIPIKHSLKIYGRKRGNGNAVLTVNGTSYVSLLTEGSETYITIPESNITTVVWSNVNGNSDSVDIGGFEVDGVLLKNSTTQNLAFGTNGFYLPMDGNSPIG